MNRRHESRLLSQMAFLLGKSPHLLCNSHYLFYNSHFSHRVLGRLHNDFP